MRGKSGVQPANSPPRVIYLAGLGRSGTTLLERLLGELPGVAAAGEVVHIWQRGVVAGERCGCGDAFARCAFWRQVGSRAFGGWDRIELARIERLRSRVDRTRYVPLLAGPVLAPALRRALDEYIGHYQRVYTAVAEVSGGSLVVDSSKHASLAFCLRWSPGIDVRVVHVVRDSRAVAYSWTRQVRRPDAAAESYMTTWSPATTAGQWNAQNGALQLLARVGMPTLRVRYEDLVASPQETLTRVAAFAGVPAAGRRLAFLGGDGGRRWADFRAAHTVSGNPMRFATGRVPIRKDERWRTAMPARQLRTVTALTLPLLARYGYLRRAA
jgi:Sulfotransferase domain